MIGGSYAVFRTLQTPCQKPVRERAMHHGTMPTGRREIVLGACDDGPAARTVAQSMAGAIESR